MRMKTMRTLARLTPEQHAAAAKLLAAAEDALLAAAELVDHPSYSGITTKLLQDIQMRLLDPVFTAWMLSHPGLPQNNAPYRRANYRDANMWLDRPAPDGSDPIPPYRVAAAGDVTQANSR
jgi:hypothetical protein